jgi:RNA polymerase sigma factor (sigma-70 family)
VTLDLSGASDGELAALQLSRSEAAAREIMRRHREPIYRLVQSHIGDAGEALDVTQEAFVAAFSALRTYDQTRPFRVWLSRIAINKCRDWARRRAVRRFFTFAAPIEAAESVAADQVPADDALAAAQELSAVRNAIAALPKALKEPLILRTIEGLSEAETAQALGVSRKAVETRLYRARLALTKSLLPNRSHLRF